MSLTGAIDTGEVARGKSVMTVGATGMITEGGVTLSTSEEVLLEVESELAKPVKGEGETVEGTLSERDWDGSGVASGPKVWVLGASTVSNKACSLTVGSVPFAELY